MLLFKSAWWIESQRPARASIRKRHLWNGRLSFQGSWNVIQLHKFLVWCIIHLSWTILIWMLIQPILGWNTKTNGGISSRRIEEPSIRVNTDYKMAAIHAFSGRYTSAELWRGSVRYHRHDTTPATPTKPWDITTRKTDHRFVTSSFRAHGITSDWSEAFVRFWKGLQWYSKPVVVWLRD